MGKKSTYDTLDVNVEFDEVDDTLSADVEFDEAETTETKSEIPVKKLDEKIVQSEKPLSTDPKLDEFTQKQKDSAGQLYPETPITFKAPKINQEQVQDNLRKVFSNEDAKSQAMWSNPAAREKLYTNLSKQGYDVDALRESGERFVNAKANLPELAKNAQGSPEAAYEYATALGDVGDHAAAFSIYTELAKQGTPSADVYKGMAHSLYKLGDEKEAQRALSVAQEIEAADKGISEIPSIDATNPQAEHMKGIVGAIEQFTPMVSQAKGITEGINATVKGLGEAKKILSETNLNAKDQGDVAEGMGSAALRSVVAVGGGAISYLMNTTPIGLAFVEATHGLTGEGTKKITTPIINQFVPEGKEEFTPDEAVGLLGAPVATIMEKMGVKDQRIKDAGFIGDLIAFGAVAHAVTKPFVKGLTAEQVRQAGETATKILKGEKTSLEENRNLNQFVYENKSFRESFLNPHNDLKKSSKIYEKANAVENTANDINNAKNPITQAILQEKHDKEKAELNNLLKEKSDEEIDIASKQTTNEIVDEAVIAIKEDLPNVGEENVAALESKISELEKDKQEVPIFTMEWEGESLKPKIENEKIQEGQKGEELLAEVPEAAKSDLATQAEGEKASSPVSEKITNLADDGQKEPLTGTESKGDKENSGSPQTGKAKIRRRGTPKRKRKIKDPRYLEALKPEPTSLREAVLQYFVGGGDINRNAIQSLFGSATKNATGETRARFGILGNEKSPTIEGLAHKLWEERPEGDERFDAYHYREAVESVLLEHNGRSTMVDELLQNKDKSDYMKDYEGYDSDLIQESEDIFDSFSNEDVQKILEDLSSEEYNDVLVESYLKTEEGKAEANQIAEENNFKNSTHLINSVNKDLELKGENKFENVQEIPPNVVRQVVENKELSKAEKAKAKVREAAEKLKALNKKISPDLPAGTQKLGLDFDSLVDGAVKVIEAAIDGGAEVKAAIEKYIKEAKAKWEGDNFPEDTLRSLVEDAVKDGEKKKKILTERAYEGEIREEVKTYLEKEGLTRGSTSRPERSRQAKVFIDQFGEDVAYEAVKNFDVRGAQATSILVQLKIRFDNAMDKLDATDVTKLDELAIKQKDVLALMEREGFFGGEFIGQLAYEYENSPELNFNVEKQIKDFKEINKGEIPADVEAKFRQLDKELKEANKKIVSLEEQTKKLEEEAAVAAIKESVDKEKKKPRQKKGKELIAEGADELARALGISQSIVGDVRPQVTKALVKIGKGLIDEGLATTENVLEKVKEYVDDKFKGKVDFEKYKSKVGDGLKKVAKKETTEGEIKIPVSLIRELVEKGVDNIEELTTQVKEALKEEYPDATDRQIRDAITDYGKTKQLNSEDIATQIRKMKRIGRIISALEDVANKKRPLKSGIQRDKLDAQERALNKELREAMKELPLDAETQAQQLKTATDAAKTRLKNQIEDLQREIDKGEKVPRNVRTVKDDAEIKSLKEQRDKLKEQHDNIFKDEEFQNKKRLEQTKQRTQSRIEDLERRIKEGDFSSKKKKPLLSDTELDKLRAEKIRIFEEYNKEFQKAKLKNRTKTEKFGDRLWDLWGLTRLLRATGEFSFVGVQGLIQSIAHPTHAAEGFKNALKFFGSESKTEQWLNKLRAQQFYPEIKGSKLSITEPHAELIAREELYMSDYANLLWNMIGSPTKLISESAFEKWKKASPFSAFERASVGYMDTLRVMRFLDGKKMLEEQGITFENNPQAFKEMADVVNTLTGRGSIGFMEKNPKLWTRIFFSPRNWSSVIKTATPYAFYHFGKMRAGAEGLKPPVAQKMAISDFSKYVGATASMVALAAAYLNNDGDDETGVEFNATSSDFLKIKLGKTRIDPWGGRIQQITLLARMLPEAMGGGAVKKESGEKIPLGTPMKTPTRKELLIEMATNKLAPSAKIISDALGAHVDAYGDNVTPYGKPYEITDEIKGNLYPIYYETIYELLKDDPKAMDGLLIFYAFLGGGVQTYGDKKLTIEDTYTKEEREELLNAKEEIRKQTKTPEMKKLKEQNEAEYQKELKNIIEERKKKK